MTLLLDPWYNQLQESKKEVEILKKCLRALSVSADTVELLLRETHPDEASSLRQCITQAKWLLET